ncbi:DUF3943 domain-containing protein [Flavobacterium sp. A45]|jgi:hypothetical protein|uniref:DUF3943 domain-containing protein n=1 Tax=Flavobacterium sp. A45 TaxID=1945862 RepID=UPI00098451AB|nr:DUF3943 domain-containing protein [Flavobacterium sp. A45]OOG67097.1 hypothetical protein B0E44_14495 [Flavobacterium sp. A45]
MIQTKNNIYSLLFTLIGVATFAQQISNTDTNQFSFHNSLLVFNSNIDKLENDKTKSYTFEKEDSFQLDSSFQINDSLVYPPTTKDYRKLGYNTAIVFGTTIVAYGILWSLPESFTKWDKEEMKKNGITTKWKENVKAGPVIDEDNFFLNYVMHPYFGGVYYMTARSNGFTILESFAYSAIMSTFFWEYGVEAFAEIPSVQDLIVTPVLGSVVGEGFFYAKRSILKNDSKVLNSKFLGKTSLLLMDPLNTIMDSFGYKQKVKTQLNVAPVGFNSYTKNPILGLNFSASF